MTFLKRLLPSADLDALLGDIVEESRHRSRLWYWSQVLAVVVVASWKDVRAHKWLAVRAIVTGLLVFPVFYVPAVLVTYVVRILSQNGYYIGPYWLTLPPSAMIVAPVLLNMIEFGLSGWAVTRFHRSHGIAMALPYVVLTCTSPAVVLIRVLGGHPIARLAGPPALLIAAIVSLPACVVLGAVLGLKCDAGRVREHD
jgi:hypothetical protein